jgi:prolyl-tRNA synthetase
VILRLSQLFLRTLREDPADAEVPSHRLLVRAGYVRRLAPGIYSWLPLGRLVLEAVIRVVREEMEGIGAQEVLLPALLPREFYEATGRWEDYGDLLFRLRDRRGNEFMLGPTHEELFTSMVKGEVSSYRDLPLTLFQIQAKYRDEARPRAGLLRGREFLMKDSYSFDLDDDGLQGAYNRHRAAYMRVFDRLGLDYRIVSAVAGAMGGSHSEEFLAPTEAGEDTYATCSVCAYAANTEAVTFPLRTQDPNAARPALELVETPGTPTIATLAAALGVPGSATLKNLLVRVTPPGGEPELVAVGVPGHREVDLRRLEQALAPASVETATDADFAGRPDLVRGYVGPQGLAGKAFRYVADPRVAPGTSWVTGANVEGYHARNVVAGRDFAVERYVDVVVVADGDPCPACGGALVLERGVEVGHIFRLGRRYADAFNLDVLGRDGKPVRVTMGSYGIGISRVVAVIAEQHHDEAGLCWPAEVAPADVHLVATGRDEAVHAAAEEIAAAAQAAGLRVLYDDRRAVSAGVKFADAELIGVPAVVVVGRGLADGIVEVRDRRTGARRDVAPGAAVEAVQALRAAGPGLRAVNP